MRRPLSCLPALLLLLAISGVAPCFQAPDGHGYPAPEQALLSADGLVTVPATMTFERGMRLLAGLCLLSAIVVWPHAACCSVLLQPHCDRPLPRRTGFRGLLPLPAPPPCPPSQPGTAVQTAFRRFRLYAGTFPAGFRLCPPCAGPVQTTASAHFTGRPSRASSNAPRSAHDTAVFTKYLD